MLLPSKALHLIAKAAVTLGAFWLLFSGIHPGSLETLPRQSWMWLTLAAACLTLQILLGVWRWKIVLEMITPGGALAPSPLSTASTTKIFYIAQFFNTCLPGSIGGDAMRVWLAKSEQVPLTLATHSVIIDRLLGLLALCFLIVLALIPLGRLAGFNALPYLLAIAIASLAGLWLLFRADRIFAKWQHRHGIAWMLYLASNLRLLLKPSASSLAPPVLAIVAQIFYCLCIYALARSLGMNLSLINSFVLIPPVPLATVLPISIGGWGVREAGTVAMLSLAGIPRAAALMLSIQSGLLNIVMCLPGGFLWLARRGASAHLAPAK